MRASVRFQSGESSAKDIAAQQHSGSRKAPLPTKETGTSGQAPHDAPANEPASGTRLPDSEQQAMKSEESGSSNYMAANEDKLDGKITSNTPFRAAPEEKKVG